MGASIDIYVVLSLEKHILGEGRPKLQVLLHLDLVRRLIHGLHVGKTADTDPTITKARWFGEKSFVGLSS